MSEEILTGIVKSFNKENGKGWLAQLNGPDLFFELKGGMVQKQGTNGSQSIDDWEKPVGGYQKNVTLGSKILYIVHRGPRGLFAKKWLLL